MHYSKKRGGGGEPNVIINFHQGYETYYNQLHKSIKQNIRTSYNRLFKQNLNIKLEILSGGNFSKNLYNPVTDLYINRHITRYGLTYSPIKKYLLKKHHFATQNYIYNKNAITFILYIENEIASFMSGLICKTGKYIVPRLSINNKYTFFSPGILLINEVIKYFSNNNPKVNAIDLSEGEEEYKYKMGGVTHYSYNFILKDDV